VCLLMVADSVEWASETPKGLWKKITDEVQAYFGYRLDWSVMYCTYSRDSRLSFFCDICSRPRVRLKSTWREVVEKSCQACKLNKEDAMDRGRWRKLIKDV